VLIKPWERETTHKLRRRGAARMVVPGSVWCGRDRRPIDRSQSQSIVDILRTFVLEDERSDQIVRFGAEVVYPY
jgi:hypothetical protein